MKTIKIVSLFRLPGKYMATMAAILVSLFSVQAYATTPNAQTYIYFDSQNNIIGQQIIDCHNWTGHAGNIDPSNPYKVEMLWHCYTAVDVQCTSGSGDAPPSCTIYGDPGPSYEVPYFLSATGATYANYCAAGIGDGFNGHPDCGQLAPVYFLGTFVRGWN